jgi:cation:H+ antiporter
VTLLAGWQLWDGEISRADAIVLLVVLFAIMGWMVYSAKHSKQDSLGDEMSDEIADNSLTLKAAIIWLVIGLLLLMASSKMLVWGAVSIAQGLGVSELIIGLTIVALGTSLPELAASIAAARKNEADLAIGNVVGSNLFNTLAVVGIAGVIHPMQVGPEVLSRDWAVMFAITVGLFIMAYGFRKPGYLTRWEGILLLSAYLAYTGWLIYTVVA